MLHLMEIIRTHITFIINFICRFVRMMKLGMKKKSFSERKKTRKTRKQMEKVNPAVRLIFHLEGPWKRWFNLIRSRWRWDYLEIWNQVRLKLWSASLKITGGDFIISFPSSIEWRLNFIILKSFVIIQCRKR